MGFPHHWAGDIFPWSAFQGLPSVSNLQKRSGWMWMEAKPTKELSFFAAVILQSYDISVSYKFIVIVCHSYKFVMSTPANSVTCPSKICRCGNLRPGFLSDPSQWLQISTASTTWSGLWRIPRNGKRRGKRSENGRKTHGKIFGWVNFVGALIFLGIRIQDFRRKCLWYLRSRFLAYFV